MTHDGPQRGVVMPAMDLRRAVRGKFGSLSYSIAASELLRRALTC